MGKYNYHTHTYRCGHAKGTEEQMILSAIENQIQELGISEHIPLPHYRWKLLSSIHKIRGLRSFVSLIRAFIYNGPNMRMPYQQIDEYFTIMKDCKMKYKDTINIYTGFEAEGIEEYFGYYQSLLKSKKVDYLILGHHFHKYFINEDYFGRNKLSKKDIYQYCHDVEKAMETQLFSYFAHPDLFLVGYQLFDLDAQTVSRRICQKAKELNIPLEINAGGIRRGLVRRDNEDIYLYPNSHFWTIASEIGNDVIIGIDAHKPSDFNENIYDELNQFAKQHNLKIIDELEFLKGK